MKKITYHQFVIDEINKVAVSKPIFLKELAVKMGEAYSLPYNHAVIRISTIIMRIIKRNEAPDLRFFDRGVYYRTKSTPFGELNINTEELIWKKYLENNKGYESGEGLLHKMQLTSLMPKNRVIVTNEKSGRNSLDEKLCIELRMPKIRIDSINRPYLQILDVLNIIDDSPIDATDPNAIIHDAVDSLHLEYEQLLYFANKYYNKKVIINLSKIAGGFSK